MVKTNLTTETPPPTSVFHGGFFYLERINAILKSLDIVTEMRFSSKNPMKIWQENLALLNALYKEIYPKMNKEQKEEHKSASNEVKSEFNRCTNKGEGKIELIFLEYFDEWELNLREIIEARGLNMPDKKDMTEAAEI